LHVLSETIAIDGSMFVLDRKKGTFRS